MLQSAQSKSRRRCCEPMDNSEQHRHQCEGVDMNTLRDLSGQVFGKLTVLNRVPPEPGKGVNWVCRCECGVVNVKGVQMGQLISGKIVSCGCHRRALTKNINTKHGLHRQPTYNSWQSMRSRCQNPADPAWERYGGRGISVCERWNDFSAFLEDLGVRPTGTSIDRINNDGNYEPGNCKWSTPTEQNNNRRPAKSRA